MTSIASLPALLLLLAGGTPSEPWVEFLPSPASLDAVPTAVSAPGLDGTEVDFAWGDLDQNGWVDLVVARKQPFTTPGKRTNLLLLNRLGVLSDESHLAFASDVDGDLGFGTPTSDRDVVLLDVDGDGWLDVATATTLGDGDPKALSHPRIYRNLGRGSDGSWQGLAYEESRIPQLYTLDATGAPLSPVAPRFSSLAAGDLTGDGLPELYFTDDDSNGFGQPVELPELDLDNRLLVNDGNGYFVDSQDLRMSYDPMRLSSFGMAAAVADLNGDGWNDVVKVTALTPPQHVAVIYNDPSLVGTFHIYQEVADAEPYHADAGDLNNDGRLDLVITSDTLDRLLFNLGTDALGRAVWGPERLFGHESGGDQGRGGDNLIVDLDLDGWQDVIITDVHVQRPGSDHCSANTGGPRRAHLYENTGEAGEEGSEVALVEPSPGDGSWAGAGGLAYADLEGVHDVAAMDVDNDGDPDLVLGRCNGTSVWLNQTDPLTCQEDLGGAGPGPERIQLCGTPLGTGGSATLTLESALPGTWALLLVALDPTTVHVPGLGLAGIVPSLWIGFFANGEGRLELPIQGGSGGPETLSAVLQFLVRNPVDGTAEGWSVTNRVRLVLEE